MVIKTTQSLFQTFNRLITTSQQQQKQTNKFTCVRYQEGNKRKHSFVVNNISRCPERGRSPLDAASLCLERYQEQWLGDVPELMGCCTVYGAVNVERMGGLQVKRVGNRFRRVG